MDRMIFTAMTGAQHILDQQATNSHNLANATSTGFKAQIDTFRAVPVIGDGLATRTMVVNATSGADFTPGAIQQTGRSLDVAVEGKGWFCVQRANGAEGYTRNGSFKVSANGILQTASGLNVLGDGGPISIPPNASITIAGDGSMSSVNDGEVPQLTTPLDRLKLVNPEETNLVRGDDGLFNTRNGAPAQADATVKVVHDALESSNVNVVQGMVNMISLARQFDIQMKLMQNAESNDSKAAQLYSLA
ncbi:flagellar basal body rod protein FlgF [Polynucleobacter sp. MWH-Mekk-B1]|uniref:flagellar basal body rod protein FlgF n=1 Tax=Polynucleobacter finlandensis TaxID=1855894 RepID=UPI001C0B8579|nr:flagellar basal body rod protein FlgF [Polynucleobacter finlandensis]MBU3545108.1 flagellar basal body rod protein FlgF [Polynucleobacter finlandensis]